METTDGMPGGEAHKDDQTAAESASSIDQAPTERLQAASPEANTSAEAASVSDGSTEHMPVPPVTEMPTQKIPAPNVSDLPTQRIAVTQPPATPLRTFAMDDDATSEGDTMRLASTRRPLLRHPRIALAIVAIILLAIASIPLLNQVSFASETAAVTATLPTVTASGTINTTPTATRDPHALDWALQVRQRAELAYVNGLISKMSLDEEIGQMIMMGFLETQISPALLTQLKQYHVGNVVYYAWNIQNSKQVQQLSHDLQANADMPLFIATDQEGGLVNRLYAVDGYLPSAQQMGASNNPSYVQSRGSHDATDLIKLGINMDFAPVVDVESPQGFLGGRTFGSSASQVTKMAGAYLQGLQQSQQVVGTLKHFPGLGSVSSDPHEVLTTFDRSESDLMKIDWAPYKSLIATGQVGAIMSTHVVLTAIDPSRPASLSQKVLTGELRGKLGYNGVIITDGIYMKALAAHYSFDDIILDAVEAGNDIICSTYSIQSTARAEQVLHQAVTNGPITKQRIDQSVRRILMLKMQYGVLSMPR